MSNKYHFVFPFDQADEWTGFNNPGIEHFSGNPYMNIGKEVTQNALDARQDQGKPVKIHFQLKEVLLDSIPDVDNLRKTLKYCNNAATQESSKAEKFFANALDVVAKEYINVLLVSDYNTTGLQGPCENGNPYYAFMKATGQSKKISEGNLGSFGIGKFAPFTVSQLRTIFVSTCWKDNNDNIHHYVQGKSVLMSHVDDEGKTRQAEGYWGNPHRCQPVEFTRESEVPDWLERDELGTTLAILGFMAEDGWEHMLASSVAHSFFGAIANGDIEIVVENKVWNSSNLSELFESGCAYDYFEDENNEQFLEAGQFLKALDDKDEQVVVKDTQNLYLGHCELRILVADGLAKKVAILRDGMFITSYLQGLKKFNGFKDFVAVFQCKNRDGNALLRGMEPPRHDNLELRRLPEDDQVKAKKALKIISTWIRDMLKEYARNPVADKTVIDELAEYFADEEGSEESSNQTSQVREKDPRGKLIIRAKPVKPKKARRVGFGAYLPSTPVAGSEDDGEPTVPVGSGGGEFGDSRFPFPNSGSGNSNKPSSGGRDGDGERDNSPSTSGGTDDETEQSKYTSGGEMTLLDVRAVPIDSHKRRIFFTPTRDGSITLKFEAAGADAQHPLQVAEASKGVVRNGCVDELQCESNQRFNLEVIFTIPFSGTLRISAK